jgi:hypothetical protein
MFEAQSDIPGGVARAASHIKNGHSGATSLSMVFEHRLVEPGRVGTTLSYVFLGLSRGVRLEGFVPRFFEHFCGVKAKGYSQEIQDTGSAVGEVAEPPGYMWDKSSFALRWR